MHNNINYNIISKKIIKLRHNFVKTKYYKFHDDNLIKIKAFFNIIKTDNNDRIKLFLEYCKIYNNIGDIIGFDFEFNNRKIALCQISFYPNKKHKFIFIVDPNKLSNEESDIMINNLFISKLHRILHGSDSLDIPYIYNTLLNNDKNKIIKFTKYIIDTRFLCEYYKSFITENNNICSLYDALLYFKVINNKKYDKLNNLNVPPIYKINWNLDITDDKLKYVYYDVLYLKRFINNIIAMSAQNNDQIYFGLKFVIEITKYVFLDKHNIINIKDNTITKNNKIITDKLNSNMIKSRKTNKFITLITIYDEIINNIILHDIDVFLKYIININYFKSTLTPLIKRVIYTVISEYYDIYINKTEKNTIKITFKELYNTFKIYELNLIIILLEKLYNKARLEILNRY